MANTQIYQDKKVNYVYENTNSLLPLEEKIGFEGQKKQQRETKITMIVVILTFINIILLIIVTSFVIGVLNNRTPVRAPPQKGAGDLCVPCATLEEGDYTDGHTYKFCKDGQTQFCITDGEQMNNVMDKLIDRKLRKERAKGTLIVNKYIYVDKSNRSHILSDGKPAAHLLGIEKRHQRRDISDETMGQADNCLRSWTHKPDTAFLHNGIDFNNGRLIVPTSGRYYVYSQTFFRHHFDESTKNNTQPSHPDSLTTAHYIYRYNARYPNTGNEKLLENAQSNCVELGQTTAEYTSYLGAVLELRAADELFVKVCNVTLVTPNPKNTYFGIYLI